MGLIITILPVVTKDLPISPRFILSRCKFSNLLTCQLIMVEFYFLTFPRFPLRKKEHQSYFGKNRTHNFRTSRCVGYILLIDHSGDDANTYGIPPEFRGGVHLFIQNRHTTLGQSLVCRVTQLRTDGVHCQESVGTGPVNLKVVPNECCLGRSPWTPWTNYHAPASLSHTHLWYEVGCSVLIVPAMLYSILIGTWYSIH